MLTLLKDNMNLEVLRFSSQEDSTNGILFLVDDDSDTKTFLCYTLEDEKEMKKFVEKLESQLVLMKLNLEKKVVIIKIF